MQLIDILAVVGEVLSWIGLGIGVPFLLLAAMVALAEGRWDPIDIAVIRRDDVLTARWFAGGDFHERPLTPREAAEDGWHRGFVNARTPSHVRMTPPMVRRLFATLGAVFTAVGIIGFILSMIPAFV